ncbi:hypothetical protein WJX77_008632 [Trebouxia sp. C0004]
MDSGATVADNFLIDNRNTWEAGLTRVDVSVAVQAASGSGISTMVVPSSITAQLHDLSCIVGQTFSNSSLYYLTNQTTDANFTIALRNGVGANCTTLIYLVGYDSAQSMVIVNAAGHYIACSPMTPPWRDFPDSSPQHVKCNVDSMYVHVSADGSLACAVSGVPQWRAILNKGYTFIMNQYYSLSQNKIRVYLHSNGTDRVLIQWTQYANVANETVADSLGKLHRLLTQIALTGMRNGSAVSHFYNYVNFRAETQAAAVFDACALAPKGENCNCTSADLAALASGPQQLLAPLLTA